MRSPLGFFRLDTEGKFSLTERIIATGCMVAAILGIAFPLAVGQPSFAILGSYLAIPLFVAPLLYLRTRAGRDEWRESLPKNRLFPVVLLVFTALFSLSVLSLSQSPVRHLTYYLLVTGMGLCILLEILLVAPSGPRVPVLLCQTGVLYLNLVWGVTMKYFFYIGRTDLLAHTWFIDNLLREGHITAVFGDYRQFPLWHIMCAMTSQLIGILTTSRQVMYLLNGLVYFVVIAMVYLIARRLAGSERVALVAALSAAFSVGVIDYGMYSISRSAVLLLILVLIYLHLVATTRIHAGLILVVALATLLFHTVSMPFLVLILSVMFLLQEVYRDDRRQGFLRLPYLVMMMVMTLVYWIFSAPYLFRIVVFAILGSGPSQLRISGALAVPLTELFNYLEYLPLLIFLIVGVLSVLVAARCSFPLKIFCLTGLLMVPLAFPGPALLIGKLASNFNLFRFQEYAVLFISLAAAVGFLYLIRRSGRYGRVAVILLFAAMCLLSVSNDFVASDNPLVKRQFYTFYLTRPEFTGFDRLVSVTDGLVLADYVTDRYYTYSPYRENTSILQVNVTTSAILRNQSTDLILIRSRELSLRPLQIVNSRTGSFAHNPGFLDSMYYHYRDDPVWDQLDRFAKVYNSGWVDGYQ
ncbi:MAG: hypothetical protein LUQ62_04270 [Methanomicrobiales archaeon]|nr:hypothetical protein [Methanomicrobiales archaeon]